MASRVKRTPRGSLKCPSSVRSIHRSASVDDENYRCKGRKGHLTASYRRRHCCCKVAMLIPSVIDLLANSKIRFDSVKRMTQIQNTSWSFAATKYFRVAAREHTLAPPGRHRPRHSRMSLTACQITPALDAAIYRPYSTLYQLQPSFHT